MEPPKAASSTIPTPPPMTCRAPVPADAAAVWRLVASSGELDVNSPYAYVLAFHHHHATSIVAEVEGEVAGFVLSYRPPEQPDTLFVWQVGVAPAHRQHGLGRRLLLAALGRERCRDVRYLEATVTPNNRASARLFGGLAEVLGAEHEVSPLFPATYFPDRSHEQEDLFRIGPFDQSTVRSLFEETTT